MEKIRSNQKSGKLQEHRNQKREQAIARQAQYDRLTLKEKIDLAIPGTKQYNKLVQRRAEMDDKKEDKKEEQAVDLGHQKPEETDNLQKSERPADDYMESRDLDKETHGKKEE